MDSLERDLTGLFEILEATLPTTRLGTGRSLTINNIL